MNLLRAIIVAVVALSALPAPAGQPNLEIYWTNQEVKDINLAGLPAGTSILRTGFYAAGDSPATRYVLSGTYCNAPDDGVQIQPSSGKGTGCWIANTSPTDPRVWGAKCTGTNNDDTDAIQKAINYAQSLTPAQSATAVRGSIVLPAGKICATTGLIISGPIDFGGAGRHDGQLRAFPAPNGPYRPMITIGQDPVRAVAPNPALLGWPLSQVRIHNLQILGVACDATAPSCSENSNQHAISLYNPEPHNPPDPPDPEHPEPCPSYSLPEQVQNNNHWVRMMVRIEDVEILQAKGSGISAKCNAAAGAVTMNNVSISHAHDGLLMNSNFDWTIYSLKVAASKRNAIRAASPVNFTCVDCELFTSVDDGIYIFDYGNDVRLGNITFVGGAIDYNQGHGLYWDIRGPLGVNLIGTHFSSNGRKLNCAPSGPNKQQIFDKSDVFFAKNSNIEGLKMDNTIFNFSPHSDSDLDADICYHTAHYNIEFDTTGPIAHGSLSLNSYFATSLDKAVSHPERVFGSSTSSTDGQYFNYEVTTFTASGPYKPRANLEEASVVLFGCGGGGGSGARDATDKIVSGGGGGGGGARADGRFTGAAVGAQQQITICTPGSGGAAGSAGLAGGATTFGSLLNAWGGGAGAGGGVGIASGGGGGGGALGPGVSGNGSAFGGAGVGGSPGGGGAAAASNASFGGGGGAGSPSAGSAGLAGGAAPYGGGGGGGSGGGLAANASGGSSGGAGAPLWNNSFPAGGANCGAGGVGLSNNSGPYDKGGSGGAGGASCVSAAAGAGGAGGFPGGGGGGGGASRTDFASGAGGAGGGGLAVVVSKYKN